MVELEVINCSFLMILIHLFEVEFTLEKQPFKIGYSFSLGNFFPPISLSKKHPHHIFIVFASKYYKFCLFDELFALLHQVTQLCGFIFCLIQIFFRGVSNRQAGITAFVLSVHE